MGTHRSRCPRSSCTPWSLACARHGAPCRAGSGVRSWGTAACAGCEGHPQLSPEGSGQPRHAPTVELHKGEVRAGCAAVALGQACVLSGGMMGCCRAPAPRRVSGNRNEPGPSTDGRTRGVWAGVPGDPPAAVAQPLPRTPSLPQGPKVPQRPAGARQETDTAGASQCSSQTGFTGGGGPWRPSCSARS